VTDLDSARDMTDPKIPLLFVFAWGVAAYLIVPRLWKLYFRQHPSLAELARVTQTSDGHPGDPINIAVVGSRTGDDSGRLVPR